jgi:hypothetical protein
MVVIAVIVLSGCMHDMSPARLRVENQSDQTVMVGPQVPDPDRPPKQVKPGETVAFDPKWEGCESRPWVATAASGAAIATIPGACVGYQWKISTSGLGSTYERYRVT